MNYKTAAGRNWAREPKRRRRVHLDGDTGRPEAWEPSPVWYSLGNYEDAAGRNWAAASGQPSPAQRRPGTHPAKKSAAYPLRERGGGDHDQPYHYYAPSARWTFPFSAREYARLLILRSRLAEQHEVGPGFSERPADVTA